MKPKRNNHPAPKPCTPQPGSLAEAWQFQQEAESHLRGTRKPVPPVEEVFEGKQFQTEDEAATFWIRHLSILPNWRDAWHAALRWERCRARKASPAEGKSSLHSKTSSKTAR